MTNSRFGFGIFLFLFFILILLSLLMKPTHKKPTQTYSTQKHLSYNPVIVHSRSNKAAATSPSQEYEAVALPELDPPGLKGEDTFRMNRKMVK